MNNDTPIVAQGIVSTADIPPQVLAAAEEIIKDLPRKDWPDDMFDLPGRFWLETWRKNGILQAGIFRLGDPADVICKVWEDIQ
jgi:hypothetical protein